ncbi:nitrate- and nitrite sensing domain-containing protein [Nonomuraea sp. NPDC046570]|uniref:sensor histidine kinase n=1 Tax=Nonomuraea sp. NPDC046570 TaxID=3155255 RepID=UPI0033ECE6B2
MLLPALAAVVLAGLRVNTSLAVASDYQRVIEMARLVGTLGEFAQNLQNERDQSARYVARGRRASEMREVSDIYRKVDDLKGRLLKDLGSVNADYGQRAVEKTRQIRIRIDRLDALRLGGSGDLRLPGTITAQYSDWIADVLALHDEIRQGTTDSELTSGVLALGSLSRAKEQVSVQRGLLIGTLETRRISPSDLQAVEAARARQDGEIVAFKAEAALTHRQLYDDTVTGSKVDLANYLSLRAISRVSEDGRLVIDKFSSRVGDAKSWFDSSTVTIERLRKVETAVSQSIVLRGVALQDAERRAAYIAIAAVLALVIAVLLVTFLMARSLVTPLRRLRSEALHIAGHRLPETVRAVRESGEGASLQVQPIGVASRDEVGEVARAFDEVHREAVRLAGEESKLRANVNAMFVNLSRRSQTLVERQITLIDGLEQGEQDEQRLANLFKLDHLATRMRRNSENLLVLAGQDPPRRWSQPVQLVDVARASLSEVENYERVSLQVPGGVAVVGQAVNDVIHLLAELVENALAFSPRETRVVVSGNGIDGGAVMMSITDSGIGMTQEELAAANERLMDSPTVDVSVSRRMGLFVVARLAHRHDIRVQLRPHGSGGLTAMVLLPESLFGGQAPAFAGTAKAPAAEVASPFATPGWPGDTGGIAPGWPGDPMGGPQGWPSDLGELTPRPLSAQAPTPAPAPTPPPAPTPGWPSQPGGGWPSDPAGWPSEPRSGGTFDTADVWAPVQGNGGSPQRGRLTDSPSWTQEPPPAERSPWPDREQGGGAPPRRYDYPETEAAATGPIPVVKPASSGDEFLPIFASIESAWFDHGDSGSWGSEKADAGWTAAAAAREPVKDGSTAAGLPKRVPKANLVPGSAVTSAPKGVAPMPEISPDRVRSRFSSFQQGYRAARGDINEGRYPGGSKSVDNREEGE